MSKKKGKFGTFVTGALVGVGLGFLFAPKSGKETRADLKVAFDDLVEKVKNIDMQEVKENFDNKIAELKKELADLDKEKVIAIARRKGNQIKEKATELVNYAVEKGTPILEDAADKVRIQSIKATKSVLAKLEKEDNNLKI